MIAFIEANRDRRTVDGLVWGVELIAAVCGIARSPYWAAKKRPPSARAIRDAELKVEIARVYESNLQVYGADKIWDHLNNEDGIQVGRCRIERLMRDMRITGPTGPHLGPHHPRRRDPRAARRSRRPQVHRHGPETVCGSRTSPT